MNGDKIRILRTLLTETTLEVKAENAQTTTFEYNINATQEDSISGSLFRIYFNNALQQPRETMRKEPIDIRGLNAQWIERMKSNLPDKMMYADVGDFITELEQ